MCDTEPNSGDGDKCKAIGKGSFTTMHVLIDGVTREMQAVAIPRGTPGEADAIYCGSLGMITDRSVTGAIPGASL